MEIVHALPRQSLSLLARKLGNVMLKMVVTVGGRPDGWYEIGLSQLAKQAGFDSKDVAHLKASLRSLMGLVFEWDVVAQASGRKASGWEAAVLFPNVKIPPGAGVVRFQVNPELLPLIVKPEVYALIDLAIVRRFRRAASLALWEHCVRFERVGSTSEVPWQTLRDILLGHSADSKTYTEFKYFKAKVLAPAVKEINSQSNHVVEMRLNYLGRFVSTVAFNIAQKQASEALTPDKLEIVGDMVALGVPQGDARRLGKMYTETKLRGALDYTKERMADSKREKLANPAAYFRHALHAGYARDSASVQPKPAEAPRRDPSEALAEQLAMHRSKEAEAYFRELEPEEQVELVRRYNDQQALSVLHVKPKAGKAARAAFARWLSLDTWGQPSSDEVLEFAARLISAATAVGSR
ncbi:hypothetical protein IWX58_004969 [Rubrivivax gelatinosus]|uniref:replication initiation protein n=1 Tax=Rubrivivax gelatinosus TaxID=28068 RepID=UPI001A1C2405|nr:replication initiation protein [Rubrivivax gelatinosus]MBG6083219.1 hypothetical protein [Rubrivivax gelatinosus]